MSGTRSANPDSRLKQDASGSRRRNSAESVRETAARVDSVLPASRFLLTPPPPTEGLSPFFSYYGGKYAAARRYPTPLHDTIVEPFAGSAGYSLWYPERSVVLVDRYPVIARLWKWLIGVSAAELLALPDLAVDQSVDDLAVATEAKSLIGFWCNAATTSPHKRMSKWARAATSQLYWGPRVRERIARQVERIRHWTVIEGDYTEAPEIDATWFVDPPYANSAGSRYIHRDIDFPALGEWCRSRRGQVLVCENEGATWLPFEPLAVKKGATGSTGQRWSREALWVGGIKDGSR